MFPTEARTPVTGHTANRDQPPATATAQAEHTASLCKWCGASLCLIRQPIHGCCSSHCYGLATGRF